VFYLSLSERQPALPLSSAACFYAMSMVVGPSPWSDLAQHNHYSVII